MVELCRLHAPSVAAVLAQKEVLDAVLPAVAIKWWVRWRAGGISSPTADV